MKKNILISALIFLIVQIGMQHPLPVLSAQGVGQTLAPSVTTAQSTSRVFLPLIFNGTASSPNPSPVLNEWRQQAHDAQRTGYTPEDPGVSSNWQFAWFWTPVDPNSMPRGAHAVTGGGLVYMPGGTQGLYAVRQSNGTTAWKKSGSYNAAAAFGDDNYLYVGSADGKFYKINPADGSTTATYDARSPINHAVLLVGTMGYVVTDDGKLHKINTSTMTATWVYTAPGNALATTPASYSAAKDLVIFGTKDLFVHAVRNVDGAQLWNVKPTSLPAGDCYPYSYEYGWPVVADTANVVLIRMRLGKGDDWLWGPGPGGLYPTTNAELKTLLDANANKKALFALNLDNGSPSFTPAAGNGGIDDYFSNCNWGTATTSTIGPMPAVKTIGNKQVAYITWKNGDVANSSWDGRWDAHMGEMVLDNSTVAGYSAGDIRFVYFDGGAKTDGIIADEVSPLTIAGNTLFHAHWGASESRTILNRADNVGLTRANPITTSKNPSVLRRLNSTGTPNLLTHWSISSGLTLFGDTRTWAGPGWWTYWNAWDPPTPAVTSGYTDGMRPRYTFVSNGMIYVIGNGGDIFALKYK